MVASYEVEFDDAETVENKIQLMEEKLRERRKFYSDMRGSFDDYGFGQKHNKNNILHNLGGDDSRHITENSKNIIKLFNY